MSGGDGVDDLSKLGKADKTEVLAFLKKRHGDNAIYTNCGSVLVAINPYKKIEIYGSRQLTHYQQAMALENEAPHIYVIAAKAHRCMITEGCNQAVVINGESGAGKTESARHVMDYLRMVSNATADLEQRILLSQPLTEYFGCAKMKRNDNRRAEQSGCSGRQAAGGGASARCAALLVRAPRVASARRDARFFCVLAAHARAILHTSASPPPAHSRAFPQRSHVAPRGVRLAARASASSSRCSSTGLQRSRARRSPPISSKSRASLTPRRASATITSSTICFAAWLPSASPSSI